MDKYIRVKNCNCISDATIEIVEKSLNIKYGSNGTGKSTISENPIYKDGQEISADVLEQGMREVSQYIPNKSYTDLINGTSTEILISSMSSDDLYHRIISIRLLFERVEGTLSLLRKKYPAACKFVNETNHVENDYIYQLDPRKYFGIPNYYLQQIENFIQENKETILAGNILTENTEVDQIGDN